jgi:hypothetical protein
MSDTDTTTEAPVRRQVRRKPQQRTQRVAMSRGDVKVAADRAEAGPGHKYKKFRARPNWESEDFVGVGLDQEDRLGIRQEKVLDIMRDGWSLQWCTRSIRGQETPQELAKMERGGWTPVFQDDFDGLLDGDFMPKGKIDTPIVVDDAILCYRPTMLQMKAAQAQRREANRPLEIAEDQIGQGIPGVTGAMHPSVRNTIKKTVERIDIPD